MQLGRQADLVVVAPATADLLARAAHGLADDLLTNTLLTARCPVLFAPAMHTEMWEHPATVDNVATLRRRGAVVLEPATGRLTGADTGKGRLPEPAEIAAVRRAAAAPARTRCPVTSPAGTSWSAPAAPASRSTRSASSATRSSGKQGYAIAAVAAARGAHVTLVAANVELPDPAGAEVVRVGSAVELREAVHKAAEDADVVVMAAAVADFRPSDAAAAQDQEGGRRARADRARREPGRPRRTGRRPQARASCSSGSPPRPATTRARVLDHGRAKLARKGCDLLVVNAVGERKAFGRPDNAAVILGADGTEIAVPLGPKAVLAAAALRRRRGAPHGAESTRLRPTSSAHVRSIS